MSNRRSARLGSSIAGSASPSAPQIANGKKRKADNVSAAAGVSEALDREVMPPPATPSPKKRRRNNADAASPAAQRPPLTPTPSAVKLIATSAPSSSPNQNGRRKVRPADPHVTNALVRTPTGSRVLSYNQLVDAPATNGHGAGVLSTAPTKDVVTLNFPAATTQTLLKDACAHLCKVDETGKLRDVIAGHQCKMFTPEGLQEEVNPFGSLASSIMAQQVSGAAASSIKKKFIGLFDTPGPAEELPDVYFPTPAAVAAKSIEQLRTAGLSQRKAEYIHGLAEKFRDGELSADMLITASDEEVMEKLVAVRGLGKWSVEMFACFALKRMDVFSTGDLGIQRGMAVYMGRDVAKLKNKGGKWKYMSEQEMIEISDRFRPYRTLFQWYMWRIGDVEIGAVAGD